MRLVSAPIGVDTGLFAFLTAIIGESEMNPKRMEVIAVGNL
ncbi:hypothetical protein M2277_000766 [Paenibacillus sp. LBL]|nr:hypothetical protein [Paenibacillus sp. LBL]